MPEICAHNSKQKVSLRVQRINSFFLQKTCSTTSKISLIFNLVCLDQVFLQPHGLDLCHTSRWAPFGKFIPTTINAQCSLLQSKKEIRESLKFNYQFDEGLPSDCSHKPSQKIYLKQPSPRPFSCS